MGALVTMALGSFSLGQRRVFASQLDQSLVDPRGGGSIEQRVLASPGQSWSDGAMSSPRAQRSLTPHAFLCRTRLDAPIGNQVLSSSVLPPSYASRCVCREMGTLLWKPSGHRKARPDAAHRYSAVVPQYRRPSRRCATLTASEWVVVWGWWFGACHTPYFSEPSVFAAVGGVPQLALTTFLQKGCCKASPCSGLRWVLL